MKTTVYLFLLSCLCLSNAKGQSQLVNSGFEQWDTLGSYADPTGWNTLNALTQFGLPPSTTLTTDAHSGNYAVKMESKSSVINDYTGLVSLGPVIDAQCNADFTRFKIPFTYRPVSVEFWYKADPEATDTGFFAMALTKWNIALGKPDTIGEAYFRFPDSVNTYTYGVATINYYLPLQPDSMYMIATSSGDPFNPIPGSILIMDDIHIWYNGVGVKENTQSKVTVYPNPANNELNLTLTEPFSGNLECYDITGKFIQRMEVSGVSFPINVSAWENGMYVVVLKGTDQADRICKISVQH